MDVCCRTIDSPVVLEKERLLYRRYEARRACEGGRVRDVQQRFFTVHSLARCTVLSTVISRLFVWLDTKSRSSPPSCGQCVRKSLVAQHMQQSRNPTHYSRISASCPCASSGVVSSIRGLGTETVCTSFARGWKREAKGVRCISRRGGFHVSLGHDGCACVMR